MNRQVNRTKFFGSVILVLTAVLVPWQSTFAQIVQQAVGGVAIDAEGVVSAPTQEASAQLQQVREAALGQVPGDLQEWTDLRAVSLKALEAEIARCREAGEPLPAAVKYLAGLQRVEYVLVYPEENDVVLAGPAEGWRVDQMGNVVGATSNRPVLLLEDLIIALRTRELTRMEPVSCSIDPTAEGMQRLQQLTRRMRTMGNPEQTLRQIEQAMGSQVVSITGVPASSHFAHVMVAADFRMKRLAMDFEPAPMSDMPSFLQLVSTSRTASRNMTPRWWLAPNYEPLAQDADGLAWQLRGQGIECLTEEDYFNAAGQREKSTQASPAAVEWAKTFTKRFSDLAAHDSAFGKLRNVMDLSVIGALLEKEMLLERAGVELPYLLGEQQVDSYAVPRRVATQANFVKRRNSYVISASGGVQVQPWLVADRTQVVDSINGLHERFANMESVWSQ